MKCYLYTILFLVFVLSVANAQAPMLLHSQAYSASGVGGVPNVNVNIPAGKNRLMLVNVFMERNHGNTANSNWPFDPDGTLMENSSSFSIINVNGIPCTYLDGRSNNHASPSGSTRFSHHYLVRYLSDADGLPTGLATVSFPNLNLPENAGDEMIVVVSVFANSKQIPVAVNSNRERAYTSSTLTVTGTSPTPDAPQTGIPATPVGNNATDVVYLANAMLSQQGTVLATPLGWSQVQSINVNNSSGTTISTIAADNEQDGVRFLSAYRFGVSNPSFTVTRSGTVRIDRAAVFLYGVLPLARPGVYGTVYRDNNGSATIDGGGTGGGVWNTANSLYVNAIGADGNVVATATVNTSGVFQFVAGGNLIEGDIILFQLSRNQGTVGQPAPTKELPTSWNTVGESITSGPNDGTADGQFTLTIGTTSSTNNTTNRLAVVACFAGTAAPVINPATNYSAINSSYDIPCGGTTANLSGLTASNKPALATVALTWHTATPATTANKFTNVTALTGTTKYYVAFYDSTNGCYSPTTELTVFAPICATNDDYTATPIVYGVGGTLPSIFGNDTYSGTIISLMPAGNVGFEYSVWTTSNATVNFTNGVLTVPATTPPGTYTYTYQITDLDTDGPSGSNFSVASVTFKVVSCTNPPASGTPDSYTQTGISNLAGFANSWPQNVPNGFIAIESKNQGFVITRVADTSAITTPVEGMLIYDISANCVKLYNGTSWKCLAKDCN